MKAFTIIIITAYCCYYANCVCIQGKNCPIGQGYCKKDKCICEYNFWTLRTKNQSNLIYCNYQRHSRFILLIFEASGTANTHLTGLKPDFAYLSSQTSLTFAPVSHIQSKPVRPASNTPS